MPTYSYECHCGHQEDNYDSMLGDRIKRCPVCKNRSLVRLIGSGAGFNLHSSGYKDRAGQSIDFKEPYFDTALRRRFSSAKEKHEFMNVHGIVQNGDSDSKVKVEKKRHYEHKMDTKKENKNGNGKRVK